LDILVLVLHGIVSILNFFKLEFFWRSGECNLKSCSVKDSFIGYISELVTRFFRSDRGVSLKIGSLWFLDKLGVNRVVMLRVFNS